MLIFGYPTNDSAKTCHISYNSSQANKMLFHTITESSNHTVKSPKRDKLHERNLSVLHSNKIIALPATTHPFPLQPHSCQPSTMERLDIMMKRKVYSNLQTSIAAQFQLQVFHFMHIQILTRHQYSNRKCPCPRQDPENGIKKIP